MTALITPPTLALLFVAVLVVAALVNRFAPVRRGDVRRMLVLFGLTCVAWGVQRLFGDLLAVSASLRRVLDGVAHSLAGVTLVAVLGALVFDVALPRLHVRIPTIAAELTTGACYFAAILLGLRRYGFDPANLLTTSAILTGILALSLQATLGNVIGGVALQLDNSIRVGDWVRLENGRQGLVREIRWRHTVIETSDWDTLIVPNALLLASTFTIMGKRIGQPVQHRMWVYFNVDFRFPPAEVIAVIETALRLAPIEGVAAEPPPQVVCYDFARAGADSMAYYAVRYWLTDLNCDDPTNSLVRVRVYAALKRADMPLAVPAAHLWVEHDSNKRRARKVERERDARRNALRTVSFLAPLTDAEIATLCERLQYTPFAAGEMITREGAVAHFLYIVTAGRAEVRIGGGDGPVVATITGPDVVGEMGLMTGAPRTASVVAVTDIACYRLDKDAFHSVLAARPELAGEIANLVSEREEKLPSLRARAALEKERQGEPDGARLVDKVRRFFGLGA
ncbi:MAG: mechanosensitive ion channel [Myxococcales bacterium]|nr:mechanosensitive ion channel [Myxococcales bacterium]